MAYVGLRCRMASRTALRRVADVPRHVLDTRLQDYYGMQGVVRLFRRMKLRAGPNQAALFCPDRRMTQLGI